LCGRDVQRQPYPPAAQAFGQYTEPAGLTGTGSRGSAVRREAVERRAACWWSTPNRMQYAPRGRWSFPPRRTIGNDIHRQPVTGGGVGQDSSGSTSSGRSTFPRQAPVSVPRRFDELLDLPRMYCVAPGAVVHSCGHRRLRPTGATHAVGRGARERLDEGGQQAPQQVSAGVGEPIGKELVQVDRYRGQWSSRARSSSRVDNSLEKSR
jgi:hypothetical protein